VLATVPAATLAGFDSDVAPSLLATERHAVEELHAEVRALRQTLSSQRVAAAASARVVTQLEGGFSHMICANAVFEVPAFLGVEKHVVESHVFSAGGFEWRMWVTPFSGKEGDHVGIYLVPADDLSEPYTADYSLAIVGRSGRLLQRDLGGGRPRLHGRRAGHGWPTFVQRADLERADLDGGPSKLLHDDGRLIVTCSGLCNVRPKGDDMPSVLARTW
jgi:hypothetical protein